MTPKELKKMKRYQLLELLIMQTEQTESLQQQLDDLQKAYDEQELKISKLGSLAEAALELNGVFEAAQNAADEYILMAQKEAEKIIADAKNQAQNITTEEETE